MAVGIVLAGRRNVGMLRNSAPDCAWEALIPIAGRPMAGYVVAALAGAAAVGRVVVAGPAPLGQAGVSVVEPGVDVSDTLRHALEEARRGGGAEDLLVAAGDSPLLTASAVTGLLEHSLQRGLGLGYPIVSRAACEARFAGVRRTYVRLREGSFTGGNCVYLRADAASSALALLQRMHRLRKRPVRLAGLLGWPVLWGLVTGSLGLAAAEAAASRLLGHRAGAWISPDAGIGVDVDHPGDLELCREVLGEASGAGGRLPGDRG